MQGTTSIDAARISDTVSRLVDEHHLPGIAVGVVSGEELVYAEGFGWADIESKRQHSPEVRQRIGSITKTMIGLSAMALVDEGRLRLEERVADLLPDVKFNGPAESLMVWNLLTHTSGIGEMPNVGDFADPDFKLWMSGDEFPGVPEAYPDGITIEVPPGTKWAYANHGWVLMGEIIARAEKASIEDVLQARVFEPLGMRDTDLLDQEHADLSTGYHREPSDDMREMLQRVGRELPDEETVDGHNIRGEYQYIRGKAAGSTQSTIADMGRYASALLRKSKGIVRPERFEKMVSPQWGPDLRLPSWGLGFALRPFFGRQAFGHGGGVIGGWNTYLTVFPEDDLGVMIHMNLSYDDFDRILLPTVVQAVLGAGSRELPEHEIEATILESAPGVYEATTPGPLTNFRIMNECGRVMITERDGALILRSRRGPWKDGVRMQVLDPSEPDLFALADGATEPPTVAMLRGDDGRVTGLRLSQLVEMYRDEEIERW